jgi:hypothetical protein
MEKGRSRRNAQRTPPDIYHFDFLLFVVDGAGLFITTPQPTTRDVVRILLGCEPWRGRREGWYFDEF